LSLKKSLAVEAASATVCPYSLALPAIPEAGAVAVPVPALLLDPPVVLMAPLFGLLLPVELLALLLPALPPPLLLLLPLPVLPLPELLLPVPPVWPVSFPGLFCDIVFLSLTGMIKFQTNESVREFASRKSFSQRSGAIVVPTCPGRLPRGKAAERHRRPAPAYFGFVVKMYGPNVAQGSEQYSTKITRPLLDKEARLM
jgi:hypothetical protein